MRKLPVLVGLLLGLMTVPAHAAVPGSNGLRVSASTVQWAGHVRTYDTSWTITNPTDHALSAKFCYAYVWNLNNPDYENDNTTLFNFEVGAHKTLKVVVRWRSNYIYGGPLGTRVKGCRGVG